MTEEDRYTRITLRIPKDLRDKLAEAANSKSHSMNAEIIQRVEESFISDTPVSDLMETIKRQKRALVGADARVAGSRMQQAGLAKQTSSLLGELLQDVGAVNNERANSIRKLKMDADKSVQEFLADFDDTMAKFARAREEFAALLSEAEKQPNQE